jgi:DNA-binding protein HU-beta
MIAGVPGLRWYSANSYKTQYLAMNMTKSDIVDIISTSTGLSKIETDAVVKGFLDTVIAALKEGQTIELRGFGSFKVVKRAQRVARNPKTNEEVIVPEQFVPVLKISKDFKRIVGEAHSLQNV